MAHRCTIAARAGDALENPLRMSPLITHTAASSGAASASLTDIINELATCQRRLIS
jgi:hypothetical protein